MSVDRGHTGNPQPCFSKRTLSRRTLLRTASACAALQAIGVRAEFVLGSQAASALPSSDLVSARPSCLASTRTSYPPLLARFIDKLDPAQDTFPTEVCAAQIEVVLARWSAELRSSPREVGSLRSFVASNVVSSSFEPAQTTPLRSAGPLRVERRGFSKAAVNGKAEFLRAVSASLSSFASLQTADFEIFGVHVESQAPLRVVTEVSYDFVGKGTHGTREQRVGSWQIAWLRDEQELWTATAWASGVETRSVLSGPGFTEITAQCLEPNSAAIAQLGPGIDHWRTALDAASGIDVYGNHGVAVGDIDGSGSDSFYVCQPSGLPNRLFRNRGDGTFEDITERSGTGLLDGTASAIFADFENRGRQDLLVVRSGGPMLFRNLGGGRFEPKPEAFRFARPAQGTFTSAAVADYNRDGLVDVYFCVYSYYQGLNQYQFPSPYYDAQNGPPNFLFRNRGDGTFEDVTVASGMDSNNNRFSFAAEWCDADGDGFPDLYVANDFGRKNFYRNRGDGTFSDIAVEAGVEDYGPGMSTCWLDYDGDGVQDLYVANMWLAEGKRITATEQFLPGVPEATRALYRKHNAGNSLYRNVSASPGGKAKQPRFENKTQEAGVARGGWSWSCAAWDFDHDGSPDLYVTNGFVSGPEPPEVRQGRGARPDLQSFFWRQVAQRSADPPGASPEYEMAWNAVNELVRSDYSWSGYQRNVFYANNSDGTFADVSGVLGLDLRDDSRAFALSDFDGDGRLEFVLKNRTGPQLRILRNDLAGIGNSLALRLTGSKSNRDAIGAVVTVEAEGKRQTKQLSAGSGFASQHTKELFFGVGSTAGAVRVSVRWPNGEVARFDNVPVNKRIAIKEGSPELHAEAFRASAAKPDRFGPMAAPAAASTIDTWLIAPLFGPDIRLPDASGVVHQLSALRGKPVLVHFFAPECAGGADSLQDLGRAAAALRKAGMAVLAVAAGNSKEASSDSTQAVAAGNEPQIPFGTDNKKSSPLAMNRSGFPVLLADDRTLAVWNIQFRYLFDRRRDLPYPSTFLIDTSGAVIRIYQGPVPAQQVLEDWQSVASSAPETRFAKAMPFAGPYFGNPIGRDYFTYGIAFVEYGHLDEAQAAFQRVVDADPKYAGAWFNLGTIYLNKKMYAEAVRCLREAVRLNPADSDAWNNLGMIAGEQEKYDEALAAFRQSALANPNHLVAVQNMMRIYQFQAKPVEAQRTLEELLAKAPENADLHLGLAMALLGQDQTARGQAELEAAVRLRPEFVDAINNLGTVLLRRGDTSGALRQFQRCRELAPDFDRAVLNEAVVYRRLGQPAQARVALQGFLSKHPDNADVRAALEKLGPS